MSLNPGKIRIFLIFKSQNFLIEKKIFALRAKIFRAQQEKIFFCCCRPAVRGGHMFSPHHSALSKNQISRFLGSVCVSPKMFFSSDQRRHWEHRELYFISFCGAKGITQNGAAGEKIIGYGVKCSFLHHVSQSVSQSTNPFLRSKKVINNGAAGKKKLGDSLRFHGAVSNSVPQGTPVVQPRFYQEIIPTSLKKTLPHIHMKIFSPAKIKFSYKFFL